MRFERDVCFIEKPGKSIIDIKPKAVERTNEVTLVLQTGAWHYGKVSMKFDSSCDTDVVEQKLREIIPKQPV